MLSKMPLVSQVPDIYADFPLSLNRLKHVIFENGDLRCWYGWVHAESSRSKGGRYRQGFIVFSEYLCCRDALIASLLDGVRASGNRDVHVKMCFTNRGHRNGK